MAENTVFSTLNNFKEIVGTDDEKKHIVCCVAFNTVTAYPFSFPFGRKVNLKNALSLHFKPLVGANGNNVVMIPQIIEQTKNSTEGVAWFCSKTEIAEYEEKTDKAATLFPAPMIMTSEVDGTGLIIWREDAGISALWAEQYKPMMYRSFMPTDPVNGIIAWMVSYARSTGAKIDPNSLRIYDGRTIPNETLQAAGEKTFKEAPELALLDFSSGNTTASEDKEKTIALIHSSLKRAAVIGGFLFAFALLFQLCYAASSGAYRNVSSDIYKAAFGEESRAPLAAVTRRLRTLTGGGAQMTFDGMLAGISAAWNGIPNSLSLDSMRYGKESAELEGRAAKTEDIQKLRNSLSRNGFTVNMGDVQQIPGGGLRFNLRLAARGTNNAN